MATIIDFLNNVFWNYVLVYGLLAVGLFFTIRLKFVQFVHFPELFRVVLPPAGVMKPVFLRFRLSPSALPRALVPATLRALLLHSILAGPAQFSGCG